MKLEFFGPAGCHKVSSVLASPRAEINNVVCVLDHLPIMLHNEYGVPKVAEVLKRFDQLDVIPLMKANGGLVENIEDPHQLSANLCRQSNALCLAGREGPCRAVQSQIIETNLQQEIQSSSDFLKNLTSDLRLSVSEC